MAKPPHRSNPAPTPDGGAPCCAHGPAGGPPGASSRRRRLWQLPAAAHDLLLGLLLPPELLRQTVARAIGHQHSAVCRVAGNEVDVLYSTVHNLGQRDAVSVALHKLLDSRCAQALRRLAGQRDLALLLQVWAEALAAPAQTTATAAEPSLPALLWALLTHPMGEALQDAALRDTRCWLYRQARDKRQRSLAAGQSAQRASEQTNALTEARRALQQAHAQAALKAEAAALEQSRLRGELARVRVAPLISTPVAPLVAPLISPLVWPLVWPMQPAAVAPAAGRLAAGPISLKPAALPRAAADDARPAAPSGPTIAGRQVLCVGGIHRAVHRYRALVEARGGHFDHHDGGIEDSVQRLDSQLAAADVVLCQAGCLNHEAYQCVKAHCKRLGKPCLYLQRPSLSQFARGLGLL